MIKKNKLTSALLTGLIGSLLLAACSQSVTTEWKSNIKVILRVDDNFGLQAEPFFKAWTDEAEKLKAADTSLKNLPKFQINLFSKVLDVKVISDDITVHKADLGFVGSTIAYQNQKNYHVNIQTLTHAFNADPEISEYDVTTSGKNFLEIGTKLSNQFNKTAYQKWTNESQFWTGNRYDFLYRLNDPSLNPNSEAKKAETQAQTNTPPSYKKINFYRGMIMMWGDDNKLKEIKSAWESKSWSTFRNFGIITGNESQASRYLLQQNLLRAHFNKKGDAFGISLADEKLKNPNSFTVASGRNIGTDKLGKFHLAFDPESSYAWTNNKDSKGTVITANYNPGDGKKIEILTVTNPNLYNTGIFSKTIDTRQMELISQALINLSDRGEDKYGPDIGYNGYRIIRNLDSEFNAHMKLTI